jgi:ribosome-associated translation inhibitor RaiA
MMSDQTPRIPKSAPSAMDPVKAIESDREFKAHVYQQLVELQPFLSPESEVSVLVQLEQDEDTEETDYVLTLVATLGEYRLECEGRGSDLYCSLGIAKRKMVEQLEEVYNAAIDSADREEEIQSLLSGSSTLH